ncbi:MAG: hypothetical protein HOP07_02490 [Bacteriovoracaceae bacterium]|nr:hypothetical protein [Bacteriovoracaceae bacterium]
MKKIIIILLALVSTPTYTSVEFQNPYKNFHTCFKDNDSLVRSCLKKDFQIEFTISEIQKLITYFKDAQIVYQESCPAELLLKIPNYKKENLRLWCAVLTQRLDNFNVIFFQDSEKKLKDIRFLVK